MSDPYFQKLFAERIGGVNYGKGTEIYKFEKIKRAKRKALADHPERKLIDFGIGENDEMADVSVRQAMAAEINEPANRGYADNGIAAFKEAVSRFMAREFDVQLDPVKEVNHCIGTKTALAMLPAAFINPGDVTLMTVPGYPVAGTHTKYYGGEVHRLPLLAENDYYPDLDSIPADILRRAKLLVINYPNSPTGRVATPEFYKKVIDFALKNEIVVVQDAAHVMFSYEGRPLSFLRSAGRTRGGRRNPFAVEGLEHDRLALGLGLRQRADRAGVRRREGQLRLRPVHRHSKSGRRGARQSRNSPHRPGEIRAAAADSGRYAAPLGFPVQDARRNVLFIRRQPERHRRRADVSPMPKRAASTSSPSIRSAPSPGTTPALSPFLRHLRSARRSRGKRPDGDAGRTAQRTEVGVLILLE